MPKSGETARERTRELVRDVQRALRGESWGRNILRLAWTAGPVTYLALQGGYLLGYGEPAPASLLIYFGGYTIIAGFAAVLARVLYQVTRGRENARGTRVLRDCLDQLPRLLLRARDLALAANPSDDAALLAAKYLLANPDATELAVAVAVRDLGGSRDLAYAVQRVEVFRRNGMTSRVQAEYESIQAEVARLTASIEARSPDTARLLLARARGEAPSKKRGRPRTEGFIERALAAEGKDEERLMSLSDVEEVLTLAIELLVGRHFPLITFEFSGDRRVAEAWTELERARREFRSRLRSRNSRLRVLAERLNRRVEDVVPSIARITDVRELRDQVLAAIDAWARDLRRPRLRRVPKSEAEEFRRAVAAYRLLEQASEALHRSHARLRAAANAYRDVVGARSATPADQFSMDGGDGIRVKEDEVGLDEQQRLTLARAIRAILAEAGSWARESVDLEADALLGVAVEMLAAIEEQMPVYRSEVQQAIELSRAPTIEALEPGLSADVRAGWAAALVDEVAADPAEYALRRIGQLIQFHGLRLSERTRTQLAQRFGIDPSALAIVERPAEEAQTPWTRAPMEIPRRADSLKAILDLSASAPE